MKKLSIIMAVVMIAAAIFAVAASAAAGPKTLQPAEGERTLQMIGKKNGWAQQPKITDNGNGTYSVVIGNGEWNNSWENDISDGQWTNQNFKNDEVDVTWNIYFPYANYSEAGLVRPATELCWAIYEKDEGGEIDFSDLNDFQVYYSDDSKVWKKAEVQIYRYDPKAVKSNGENEFDPSCGAPMAVRFVFKEAINAKYFFIYDPNPQVTNIKHWSTFFCAAYTKDGSTAWVEGASQGGQSGAADTADYTAVFAVVLAVSALGAALICKKNRK